jgi:type IV secretory pathway protease TraF
MFNFAFSAPMLGAVLNTTAAILAIPNGTNDAARTTHIASLACSTPQAISAEEAERAGLATTARLMRSHTAVPGSTVTVKHRFACGGVDYRIRGITPVPNTSPRFYQFLLEDEGVASV